VASSGASSALELLCRAQEVRPRWTTSGSRID
jgi:hypothetical protein